MAPAGARLRGTVVLLLWLFVPAAEARADWLIVPFIGTTFGAETSFLDLEVGAALSKHTIFGGSGAWLSDGVLGIEGDMAFSPSFFSGDGTLVEASNVMTLFGNVMAAVPLSISRESLRPYVLGGVGLVRVRIDDTIQLALGSDSEASLGLQLGAGAVGLITNRIGLRFDLRHTRTLSRSTTIFAERETALSFWRATVGVVARY